MMNTVALLLLSQYFSLRLMEVILPILRLIFTVDGLFLNCAPKEALCSRVHSEIYYTNRMFSNFSKIREIIQENSGNQIFSSLVKFCFFGEIFFRFFAIF